MFTQNDLHIHTIVSEIFAINVLANHFKVDKKKFRHLTLNDDQSRVDFLLEGSAYDVKFSNPTTNDGGHRGLIWDFAIRGKYDYCDWFVLIGMVKQRPQVVYLVPAKNAPRHHIRISLTGESKWDKYKIWEKDYER